MVTSHSHVPTTCCSGGSGAQQYPSGRLLTSSAPQPSMAELMAEIAANEYAASGGGGPLVQRAAQVGQLPASTLLAAGLPWLLELRRSGPSLSDQSC